MRHFLNIPQFDFAAFMFSGMVFADVTHYRRLRKTLALLRDAFDRMEMEFKLEVEEVSATAEEALLRRRSALIGSWNPPDSLRSLELHLTAALKDLRIILDEGVNPVDELGKVAEQDRLEKLGYHVRCCILLLDVRVHCVCIEFTAQSLHYTQ